MTRVAVIVLVLLGAAAGQELPRFAVTSIKPSADNEPGARTERRAPGDYSVRKVTLSALLASAYGIPTNRIYNAPEWWKIDRFDVEARYGGSDGQVPPMPLLLQSLLRDRFALVAHVETRELPVYVLRVAARDGRPRPGLQRSTIECAGVERPVNAQGRDAAANGAPLCGAVENPEAFIASGMSIDILAGALRPAAGRDVLNETGLTGRWDITLQFAPLGAVTSDRPSVFTALQEQLGLKLESATAPLDVLVVDRVSRPTPN